MLVRTATSCALLFRRRLFFDCNITYCTRCGAVKAANARSLLEHPMIIPVACSYSRRQRPVTVQNLTLSFFDPIKFSTSSYLARSPGLRSPYLSSNNSTSGSVDTPSNGCLVSL